MTVLSSPFPQTFVMVAGVAVSFYCNTTTLLLFVDFGFFNFMFVSVLNLPSLSIAERYINNLMTFSLQSPCSHHYCEKILPVSFTYIQLCSNCQT